MNSTQLMQDLILIQENTTHDLLVAGGIILGFIVILHIFKVYILSRLSKAAKKTENTYDDAIVGFVERIAWPFHFAIGLFVSSNYLVLPIVLDKAVFYIFIFSVVYYAIKGAFGIIDFLVLNQVQIRKEKEEGAHIIRIVGTAAKAGLVIIAGMLFLSNIGFNISSLLAGVGIGGIAIAFAIQNILEDLFSSFTIFFDKPFKEGDFIVIGNDSGTVKKIGIKSTRIQTLQGQELIVSNKELTSTRINNYKLMKKRRAVFSIGVEYGTTAAKLQKIPKIIEGIINKIDKADLDRVHFKEFGDFSLNYEIVYHIANKEYGTFMDIQQKINLELVKIFKKEKIEFAFPTQTVFVKK